MTAYGTTEARGGSLAIHLVTGLVGGFLAGIVWIALTSWFVTTVGLGDLSPFRTISTIALGPHALVDGTSKVWVGEAIHSGIAAFLGLVFAALTYGVRYRAEAMVLGGVLFGGVVYAVDFQLLARYIHQFSALFTANAPFELAISLLYGALLAAFFLRPVGYWAGGARA